MSSLNDVEAKEVVVIETTTPTGEDSEEVQSLHKTPVKAVNKSLFANRLQIKRYDSLDVIDRLSAIKISPRMLLEKKERGNVEKSIVELQDTTHFGKLELAELFSKYSNQIGENSRMNKQLFNDALRELLNIDLSDKTDMLQRYYDIFDIDKSGTIDFREFVTGLSVLLKGSFEEKVDFIFTVYDEDGNGFIERHEMSHLLSCLFNKSLALLSDVRKSLNLPEYETSSHKVIEQCEIEKIVDKCFEQVTDSTTSTSGTAEEKKISKEEFGKWIYNQPSVLQWISPGVKKD